MGDRRENAVAYAREHVEEVISRLSEFIAIPSVSTDPEHQPDIETCAQWLVNELGALGIAEAEVIPTAGKPVVWGDSGPVGAGAAEEAPTLLVYGHYDVQPADPFELWTSDPFTPEIRGDSLYGRGASDMKGQVIAVLSALHALRETGELPVRVKFLIEGEEEVGSPNLLSFVTANSKRLAADLCLNPDTGMLSRDDPTITYGLRGLVYQEVRLIGPAHDLHSGIFGGAVHNPAQVLAELIAGLHDQKGRVTLPGFYDNVRTLSAEERESLARLPMSDEFYLKQSGAPALFGESGFTAEERVGARPTLEVNGILSGFTGEGAKTVLPSRAMAKISMRLVPNQDPQAVRESLRRYVTEHLPPTVTCEIVDIAASPPLLSPVESAGNQALADAIKRVWGKKPLFKLEGGSVPVSTYLQDAMDMPSVLTGFGLPDDNLHAPNEKLDLPAWKNGIQALIHFMLNLGER